MVNKTPGLEESQINKAVKALLKFVGQQHDDSMNLLDEDEFIYLVFSLKKCPQGPKKNKPIRIQIPHPLYDPNTSEVCVFVKDHKGEGHKAAKAQLKQKEIAGVKKVVGVSKLKGKYESFEAKRQLCNSFDLFLADDRIIPAISGHLGKQFFKKKKQPVPVDLGAGKDWSKQIQQALRCTFLFKPSGTSLSIRVARSSFGEVACVENILAVVQSVVEHIPKKWSNVQSLFLKTTESVALPMYQCLPEEALQIKV